MQLDYIAIGKRIKAERIKSGIKQKQLAEIMEVSPAYYSRLESGSKPVSLPQLIKIANVLLIESLDFFICDTVTEHKHVYDLEVSELLDDCDHFERIQLLEILQESKIILRKTKDYYQEK